jgi:hypothetical protein
MFREVSMEEKKDRENASEEVKGTVVEDKPVEKKEEAPVSEEKHDEFVNVNKEELKKQLTEAYTELGTKFYKEVCAPSSSGRPRELPRPSLFTEQVTKIKTIKEKIDNIVAKELAAKGLKACPECDNEVVLESKFCNMCGYKFPSKNDEKKIRPVSVPRCKACGANLEPDSVFCPDCGKRQ